MSLRMDSGWGKGGPKVEDECYENMVPWEGDGVGERM